MTKSKLKIFGLIITVCMAICAVFAGCLSTEDYEEIYKDDGKIASSTSSTSVGSVQTSAKGSYKLSCMSFSGVKIIVNSFTVDENTSANLSFGVEKGKCKVVLVNGKNVYTITEGDFDGEIDLKDIPHGKYKVKIAGVEAEFKLTLTYNN